MLQAGREFTARPPYARWRTQQRQPPALSLIGIVLVPVMLKGLGEDSYGIWIAALSVAGTVGLIDFGLGLSITREAATSLSGDDAGTAARFIATAGTAWILIGVVGGFTIATLGLPLSKGLHL